MRIFKSRIVRQTLSAEELAQLVSDFSRYKSTGIPADNFGRDVPYDHPNTLLILKVEDVYHLHSADNEKPWSLMRTQYSKTSDIHLVYCQSALNSDCYLLMAVLQPNAHEQANDNSIMHNLGLMAEQFRQQY